MFCLRQISYAALLQDYPFKGSEGALKALEAHDLVQVSYVDGRPSMVRPGKPVFRHAFGKLVEGELETGSQSVELPFSLKTRMNLEINLLVIPLLTTSPRSFHPYFARPVTQIRSSERHALSNTLLLSSRKPTRTSAPWKPSYCS